MPASQNMSQELSDVDDDGLDIDTEQMVQLRQKFKEPDLWPQTFSKHVKKRQSDMVTKLAQIKEDISADRRRFEQEFLTLANAALLGLSDEPQSPTSTTDLSNPIQFLGAEGQPLCSTLVDLLKQADAVIYVYDQLARRSPQSPSIQDISTSFAEEKEVAAKTIKAGKRVVGTVVDGLLADGFHEVRNGRKTITTEEKEQGRLLLARGVNQETPEKQTLGWGRVARDTERAMQKLCYPKQ